MVFRPGVLQSQGQRGVFLCIPAEHLRQQDLALTVDVPRREPRRGTLALSIRMAVTGQTQAQTWPVRGGMRGCAVVPYGAMGTTGACGQVNWS